jgi:hypothetical protein
MQFEYWPGVQRTKEWYDLRIGKVTASRLDDWLAVSKAKGKEGKPLQKRLDYERELQYERQFGVAYQNYVSDAMLDGVELEDFARRQYQVITGYATDPVGAWYNDHFVASPDSMVFESTQTEIGPVHTVKQLLHAGLLEIKIVRDNTFSDILLNGVPQKHWRQVQGQLWASGLLWCDYVALNLNTKKIKIIRVEPDTEFHEWLELAVPEPISVEPFSEESLYDISGEVPSNIFGEASNEPTTVKESMKW